MSRRQLRRLGVDRFAEQRRVASGRLVPKGDGVCAVGHGRLTPDGRLMRAVLAYGGAAATARRDAAAVHGALPTQRGPVHIAANVGTRRAGTILHRAKVDRRDVTTRRGIPVTTLARTLADLAADPLLERIVTQLQIAGLLKEQAITRALALAKQRPGAEHLRRELAATDTQARLRSPLEVRFRRLLHERGAPAYEPNYHLDLDGHRYEIDCAWPAHRVAVELDSHPIHTARANWEADRDRDARLLRAGWRPHRFTSRQVDADPDGVVATVLALLGPVQYGSQDRCSRRIVGLRSTARGQRKRTRV